MINLLKKDIIYRTIDQDVTKGTTLFYSPSAGATLVFGSSCFYNHLKNANYGERNINDVLNRYNKLSKVHEILTNPESIYLGITTGQFYTFTEVADSNSEIMIVIKDNEVYSLR